MYAQCPECLAIYKLGAAPLTAARGRVRCAGCGSEFDALLTLVDELPSEHDALPHHPAAPPPLLSVPALRPQAQQRELFVTFDPDEPRRAASAAVDSTLRADRHAAPSFVRRPRARRAPKVGLGWRIGVAVLVTALATQWAWLERGRLLANATVLGIAESVCAQLRCAVPSVRDERRIALLARDVRPHPTVPNALVISATLANQAPFSQPYPIVEITLADPNELRIAMRRFRPDEYIADGAALARGLAAGATAAISFEVEDPGKNAVAFEFKFL